MRGLAYALPVFRENLFGTPANYTTDPRSAPVQRDPGLSVHVRPDEAFVVPAPAASAISTPPAPATSVRALVGRVTVRGKFLFVGDEKFYVRGVTYGAFEPDADGREYQDLEKIERDFAHMAANGINSVPIPHTMPPRALLDVAARHGLRVMVGLSAEQYVGYLIDGRGAPDVEGLVAAKVRACAGHPALLCYALGNEIPASIARWLGRERVQRYLQRLYRVVKREDPEGLVTYVNYPTTEYLELPFLDIVCFNVYLETQERLRAYLARLQNIAGDRPLLMSELGLDSLRNGERVQAQVLDWQVRTAFAAGLAAASGEIVAYIDDDAFPDPHWLRYLAATFASTSHAGVGGPNIAPTGDGPIAECVARAPGGPLHVLLSDCEAEHIPGCNMAFRKACLEAIGGFDPQFRTAGDDVDVCWRLQERGWTLGFSPAAMVWHHRRNSLRTYWKQQTGYGRAEAMLERKWPEKYNGPGHVRWAGRIYGSGLTRALRLRRARVYHGIWGLAPYQSLYEPAPSLLGSLPLMPEWYLAFALLMGLSALSFVWSPLTLVLPLLVGAALLPLAQAGLSAAHASFPDSPPSRAALLTRRLLTAALHLVQPPARLRGRLRQGLTLWRCRGALQPAPLRPVTTSIWSEHWQAPDRRLNSIAAALQTAD